MSEYFSHISQKRGSEKSFALVFASFFFIVAFYPLFYSNDLRLWAFISSGSFILLGYILPRVLYYPNLWWFKLGEFLGAIMAPLIISLVYFTTVVPIGLLFRLSKKDLIKQKINPKQKSYWIKKNQGLRSSMKNQF